MRSLPVMLAVVLSVLTCLGARASDRNARMIDAVAFEFTTYDGGNTYGGTLWGEQAFATPKRDWAVLVGGGYGAVETDGGDDANYWKAGAGLKYYVFHCTSLALIGFYERLDYPGNPDTTGGQLTLEHRLIPAEDPISPFLKASGTFRNVDTDSTAAEGTDFSELVAAVGFGCDFAMNDELVLVLETTWNQTEGLSDDGESPNWWWGSVAMQYYWE